MAKPDPRLDPKTWINSAPSADEITPAKEVTIGNTILPLLNAERKACVSSLLFGAQAKLCAQEGQWSLLAGVHDDYLGWAKNAEFQTKPNQPIHQVHALSTHLYEAPNIKSLPTKWLPMGAKLNPIGTENDFIKTEFGYAYIPHLQSEKDAASYAQKFLETPYLWGGGSSQGIDCSGLTQRAFAMVEKSIPRDSDQQESSLQKITRAEARRNDLVFWKGHVGLLADENTMLHATAFVMKTIEENLDHAIARIGEPTSFRRVL